MLRRHFDHETHLATGQLRGGNLGHEVVGSRPPRSNGRPPYSRSYPPRCSTLCRAVRPGRSHRPGTDNVRCVSWPSRSPLRSSTDFSASSSPPKSRASNIPRPHRLHTTAAPQPQRDNTVHTISFFIVRFPYLFVEMHIQLREGEMQPLLAAIRCRTARSYRKRDPSNRR